MSYFRVACSETPCKPGGRGAGPPAPTSGHAVRERAAVILDTLQTRTTGPYYRYTPPTNTSADLHGHSPPAPADQNDVAQTETGTTRRGGGHTLTSIRAVTGGGSAVADGGRRVARRRLDSNGRGVRQESWS